MFVYRDNVIPTPCEPGVSRKILSYDEKVMMCEITFEKGAKGKMHTHPHTQVTYIVKGSFAFTVNGETKVVNEGDSVLMPSGSLHGCECLEAGILCDVFAPMREDFLK